MWDPWKLALCKVHRIAKLSTCIDILSPLHNLFAYLYMFLQNLLFSFSPPLSLPLFLRPSVLFLSLYLCVSSSSYYFKIRYLVVHWRSSPFSFCLCVWNREYKPSRSLSPSLNTTQDLEHVSLSLSLSPRFSPSCCLANDDWSFCISYLGFVIMGQVIFIPSLIRIVDEDPWLLATKGDGIPLQTS